MAKKSTQSGAIRNRRASYDFELGSPIVVGLALTGAETKALRLGHGQLQGAYVNIVGNELFLLGAQIHSVGGVKVAEETRNRKLLAKRSEIEKLAEAKRQGNTIVPLEILTHGNFIKLRIAPGKGKRQYDKRETLKKRQQERDIRRQTSIR